MKRSEVPRQMKRSSVEWLGAHACHWPEFEMNFHNSPRLGFVLRNKWRGESRDGRRCNIASRSRRCEGAPSVRSYQWSPPRGSTTLVWCTSANRRIPRRVSRKRCRRAQRGRAQGGGASSGSSARHGRVDLLQAWDGVGGAFGVRKGNDRSSALAWDRGETPPGSEEGALEVPRQGWGIRRRGRGRSRWREESTSRSGVWGRPNAA